MQHDDDELRRFKRDIDLVEYATDRHGYRRDRRESSRLSHVLRHPESDDKVIVRIDPKDGRWTYFSVRDGRDHGTIVDFVQRRGTTDLGHVRQELRRWLGLPRTSPLPSPFSPPPTPRALPSASEAFARARSAPTSAYLEARGLRRETLTDPRFHPTWRIDRRGSVLFVHRDATGEATGCEIKNRGFTRFSPGGHKAAWQSIAAEDDQILVVAESAIDALSYHQLHKLARARYLSTSGTLSPAQRTLLAALFQQLPRNALVLAAVDSDAGGDAIASELEALTRHAQLAFARHSPDGDKDWNDVLQRATRAGFLHSPDRPLAPEAL